MTVIRCKADPTSCVWEVDFADAAEGQRGLDRHLAFRHPSSPPVLHRSPEPVSQLASVAWETTAIDALQHLARTRAEFTVYDVHDFGVGEPIDPQYDWGRLTRKARHLGIIEPVVLPDGSEKAVQSRRPGTRASLVKVWQGTKRYRPAVRRQA